MSERKDTVVIVGGHGGLSSRYREVLARVGFTMNHYERRVPESARHAGARIAMVVVMVTLVSHSLREQALALAARDQARVLFLRSPSVSALRDAVARL